VGEELAIRTLTLILAALLATASAVPAEERPAQELGEVVVEAPEMRDAVPPPDDPTAFATVIDTRDAPTRVETLADALSDAVGVQVRRFGGLGDFATVSVRGFSPRQVQVYLDGVPLSRADSETVDLSDLPLDAVERVEVYRGATPLRFAQAGPGGVVNVVTRRPGATPLTAASASYGSFETRKVNVTRSATEGAWSYLLFGHYMGTLGDFTYPDTGGTPENPDDDREITRINNDFDLGSLVGRVAWRPSDTVVLSLTTDTFGRDRGYPGRGVPQDANTRRQTVRQLTRVDGTLRPRLAVPLTIETSGWFVYDWQAVEDPLGPVIQLTSKVDESSLIGGGQVLLTSALGRHHVPGLLVAASHETFSQTDDVGSPSFLPGRQPDRTRLRGTVAAEDEIVLLDERVSIVPGLRWEGFRDDAPPDPRVAPALRVGGTVDRSVWSPRTGVRVGAFPGLDLLGNAGHYERVPSLQELFGAAGVVVGNPDLVPEKTLNWDVGLRWRPTDLGTVVTDASVELAFFDNQIDDVIVVESKSVNLFTSRNIAQARVTGQEMAASLRLWDRVGVTLNYTHQDAVNESDDFEDGNQLPGRPAHEAYARVEWSWRPERPLPVGVWAARFWPGKLWFDANIIADNFLNSANTQFVARRDLFGAGVEIEPVAKLRLGFQALNLTNDQTRDALDFPLPGRSFYGTVSWGF
jgi:iron complex outermembrane recepter protein